MARLVAIGDSLTQGFQSLAITHTNLSYPAMLAESMGLGLDEFRLPTFHGSGGLPCSLEWLARRLESAYGPDLNTFEWLAVLHTIPSLLDEVEDYWERGRGSQPVAPVDYHNLAVWGFEVADAYNITAKYCFKLIQKQKDDWFALPSEPRLRTAYRVLNPAQLESANTDTQLAIAKRIKEKDATIDHLIVALGANNCLGTVVDLCIDETGAEPPGPNSKKTLWTTSAFEKEYTELAKRVADIGAKNVYVATVPHVTIPPITRGVMKDAGMLPEDRTYFDYYTRFFIKDKEFDPRRDPRLTGQEAEYIDERIDTYNTTIRKAAAKHGFHVVDLCALLDSLAVRRTHGKPTYNLPPALADLDVRFFEIQPSGRIRCGGLMSLDGVHPTACGYALIANAFLTEMKKRDSSLDHASIDYAAVRRGDPLVTRPPRTLNDIFGGLQLLEKHFHLSRWMSNGALRKR